MGELGEHGSTAQFPMSSACSDAGASALAGVDPSGAAAAAGAAGCVGLRLTHVSKVVWRHWHCWQCRPCHQAAEFEYNRDVSGAAVRCEADVARALRRHRVTDVHFLSRLLTVVNLRFAPRRPAAAAAGPRRPPPAAGGGAAHPAAPAPFPAAGIAAGCRRSLPSAAESPGTASTESPVLGTMGPDGVALFAPAAPLSPLAGAPRAAAAAAPPRPLPYQNGWSSDQPERLRYESAGGKLADCLINNWSRVGPVPADPGVPALSSNIL
eukprot:gene4931-biopygen8735